MQNRTLFSAILIVFSTLLFACTPTVSESDGPVILGESSDANTGLSSVSEFQIIIPADDLQIGSPRIPFIIMDGGRMVSEDVSQVFLTVFDINQEPPMIIWEGPATNFADYEVPYWVFYPEIPTAGNFGVRANILQADGGSSESQFAVAILEEAIAPAVGDAGVRSASRTGSDADTLEVISSDPNPDVSLYALSLDEALSNGRPTVISFSTPAYCQTAICAPVLGTVKKVKNSTNSKNGEIDFVHVEIFGDFETFTVADTIDEWKLQSEPWTYVLDADGVVTARLAGPVSPTELESLLDFE